MIFIDNAFIPFISKYPFGITKTLFSFYMHLFPPWLISGIITAPFKRMKIIKQLNTALVEQKILSQPFTSYVEIAKFIYEKEGFWGFYRGSILESIGTFPKFIALILSISIAEKFPSPLEFLFRVLTITIQSYSELSLITYPLNTVNQEGLIEKNSMISITSDRISQSGFLSLYSGFGFNFIGIIFQCCAEYGTMGLLRAAFGISGNLMLSNFAYPLIFTSIFVGEFIEYPFETISRAMIAFPEKKIKELFSNVRKDRAFWKGFSVNTFRQFLSYFLYFKFK